MRKTSENYIDAQSNDGKQVYFNESFVEIDTKVKTKEELDYEYPGYTLEITDKVRLIPLSRNGNVNNVTNYAPVRRLSQDIQGNRKFNRKVSFVND